MVKLKYSTIQAQNQKRIIQSLKLMDQNFKKVFHTAIVITPPIQFITEIQQIRQKYDKAYDRWMPHVNLTFPFFDVPQFDQSHQKLQDAFKDFPAFDITLREFKYFDHGTVWLNPESPNKEVNQVYQTIVNTYPVLNDLGKKSEEGFTPHISVGQFPKNQLKKSAEQLQNGWKEISFKCQEIFLIARNGQDQPFKIIKTIRLKSDNYEQYQYLGQ
ncbi:hypothetical protein pb186bvf_001848 [Paramecium bursaria]